MQRNFPSLPKGFTLTLSSQYTIAGIPEILRPLALRDLQVKRYLDRESP